MAEKFDFEAALKAVQSGQSITGKDGVLGPLVKQLTEAALEAELDSHLAEDVAENRRNGKSRKTVKSASGKFELETPRDRAGTFEPQLVKKHQRTVSDEIETKILSMYGLGMSYAEREACPWGTLPGTLRRCTASASQQRQFPRLPSAKPALGVQAHR